MAYQIEQKVFADFGRFSVIEVHVGEVIEVLGSGAVKVHFGTRQDATFLPGGRLRGGDKYSGVYLKDFASNEKEYNSLVARQLQKRALSNAYSIRKEMELLSIRVENKPKLVELANKFIAALDSVN